MIGEIRQNFTEASASVGLILATALVSLWKCIKKSKYHLDIVIFLHSEHLLIIFRFVCWRHLPGESQDFPVVAPPCDS